jgi:DNA-binding transcriptional LysR family regulator
MLILSSWAWCHGTVRPRENYGAILDAGKLKAFTYHMHNVHMVRLELSQVKLLAELSRTNGLTSAASNIGLSQSAASHALGKLRKQLGDPLFLRTANGLRPTPYGQRVGLAAREALEVLAAGLASNQPFEPQTTTRTFSCYMSDVGMMVMLPSLMAHMKKHAPGSSVRSAPIPLINPGGNLSSGEVDVAVGFFDNLSSGFLQRFLFRERYVCIVRSGHAGFRGGMSVEAFKKVEHAMADATGMAHAVIDRSLEEHKIPRIIALRVPGFQMLPAIVANSDLAAIVPGRLADTYGQHLPIKVLPTPIPMPAFDIRLFWHERYHHDPPHRWFRQVFVDLFQEGKGR